MDVDVTVVIATRDRASLLAGALGALERQVTPPDLTWEVVVVDNGSTDQTPDAVAAAAARAGSAGAGATPAIRYVLEPELGLSNARNRGVREARGALIAFTDDDVLPEPDWVAAIASAMSRWHADGVGGRILARWEADPPRWLIDDPRLLDRLTILDAQAPGLLTASAAGGPRIWGANMAFRRTVFEALGAFDPSLGMSGRRLFRGEETDFVARALAHGFRIAFEPALVVFHRIGPDRMRRGYFRRLFFDAGVSDARATDLAGRRTLLGAPIELYRVPIRVARWLARLALRRPNAFRSELRWRHELGQLIGYWQLAGGAPTMVPDAQVGEGG